MTNPRSDDGELPAPHAGLPVSGYRPQTDAAVAMVNQVKQTEELVLRLLDDIAEASELAADRRWFSIGRTAIEQGFMAVNRSIFKPERVAIPDEDDPVVETGWVLERADSEACAPLYYAAGNGHGQPWSALDIDALRLARKADAERLAAALGVQVRVAEHRWG